MQKSLRHSIYLLIGLTGLAGILLAETVIQNFNAFPVEDNKVLIKWETSREDGSLEYFKIIRSTNGSNFFVIDTIHARNKPHQYEYTDDDVFAKPGTHSDPTIDNRVYTYKLGLSYGQSGSDVIYEKSVEVAPRISGTNHTWGSIKAMFR